MAEIEKPVRATGGCLCGAVRYAVRGPLRDVIACHCNQCRRMSGHYVAATATPRGDLDITGEADLTWYRASSEANRAFCATCGSTLFWQSDKANFTSIFAGSLDQGSGLQLAAHIFVGDKGDYYEITDDLPHFEGYGHGILVPNE